MNNYWVTNFNADQRGGHTLSYYLTSSNDISDSFASRFGWGSRVPYLTRILPGEGTGDNYREGSFIEGWPENVILVSAHPVESGKAILIHLRETGGKEASLNLKNGLTGNRLNISGADVTGRPVQNSDNSIGPLESKFFLIRTDFQESGR
jgi:alpha-mannosidase